MGVPVPSRRETNQITCGEIHRRLKFRAQLSIGALATLGATGLVFIAIAAGHLDGARVCLVVGVGLCQAAFTMLIAWGAASNHGMVASLVSDGFEQVTEIERETGNAVVVALDEVRKRRRRDG
jgi:hypothetical protein